MLVKTDRHGSLATHPEECDCADNERVVARGARVCARKNSPHKAGKPRGHVAACGGEGQNVAVKVAGRGNSRSGRVSVDSAGR